jgi:hypothetical protein
MKRGVISYKKSYLKPFVREKNRMKRIRFVVGSIIENNGSKQFSDFYDRIHIDEKWFYITTTNKRFILLPCEEAPYRTAISKNFITKVMFLAAVARPRKDPVTGEWIFNGKIGIWPFVKKVAAKRASRNRPRGTIETKPITVDREVYLEFLRVNLLPAISTEFPNLEQRIIVQQDNAGPHVQEDEPDFLDDATIMGLDVSLKCQPPQSPDFNVLDLGFFNAIQSLQQQKKAETIEQLIQHVEAAFNELSPETLEKVWITLMGCMEESLWVNGGNNYTIPHLKKDASLRNNQLPTSLEVSDNLYNLSLSYLAENAQSDDGSDEEEVDQN